MSFLVVITVLTIVATTVENYTTPTELVELTPSRLPTTTVAE
jgi:hypothetical protein